VRAGAPVVDGELFRISQFRVDGDRGDEVVVEQHRGVDVGGLHSRDADIEV
jgi:hypothetical protein